jgi:hypothetical protein
MANKYTIGAKIVLEGEKEYRQAINNCNNSMRVLKSELKAVAAEYANNANSLEALRAKNDILTKQQEEQEKKLALLRGALEKAAQLYGENSTQVQNWQVKLNNAYAELQKINRELDDNQRYLKEAEESTNGMAKSIDEYGKEIKEAKEETLTFGDVLKANLASEAIISGVKALFNAIKDGSKALVDVVKETAAYADNILTLSVQTGIATDTLQELNYMAELTDTSLETIAATMARNIRSMNSAREGTKLYADAYRSLGVNVIDPVTKQLRDAEAVYWDVIDALGKMANETERDAIAMQIFGRSARDLNPLIAVGKQGVAELADEARRMGAVLSQETLESLGQTDDALQRMYQQFDIAKRKIGLEAAPGITEAITKVTEKIGEADDKFAEFISDGVNGLVNGFIWLIDHSDAVIAGLKGITAAIITKKAAEGIEYAVNAYKALKTATEAATAAQATFNSVSKANAIGAIASVIVGLGTALYTYSKNAKDAAEETKRLNDSTQRLLDSTKELHEEISKNIKDRKESSDATQAEYEAAKRLADTLFDLAEKENKTSAEKSQMLALTKQLNEIMPDLNLAIDNQTWALNKQRSEVEQLIEAELQLQRIKLASANIAQIEYDRLREEQRYNELIAEREKKAEALARANKAISDTIMIDPRSKNVFAVYDDADKLKNEIKDLNRQIDESKSKIDELMTEYQFNMDYIGKKSPVEAAAKNSKQIVSEFTASIDDISGAAGEAVEGAINKINSLYDEASENLSKRLKDERKAFEENQQAQVKAVQNAQKEQLKLLEANHKKKLEMIDQEYMERLKTVDEERYNELKKIQEQIDAIDAQQEAEDRAAKLKEEAEKRAELQAKISNAKTIEDRMDAQKELQDFEEKVARDRLKTERDLQKDILKEQKEKINDYYDEKVRVIEEEKKKQKEAAEQAYEYDKSLIEQKYRDELEALKKIQEEEKESFSDRQEEYKKFLKEQKDLAIENAKKTYEEDLRLFKLNNSLKEQAITKADYLSKLKTSDIMSGKVQVSTSDLMSYMQYGAPVKSEVAQIKAEFDYNDMVDAFTTALKKLNLTVVLDGKKVGSIVQNTVNKMIY